MSASIVMIEWLPYHADMSRAIGRAMSRVQKNQMAAMAKSPNRNSPARMIDIVESTLSLIRTIIKRDQMSMQLSEVSSSKVNAGAEFASALRGALGFGYPKTLLSLCLTSVSKEPS